MTNSNLQTAVLAEAGGGGLSLPRASWDAEEHLCCVFWGREGVPPLCHFLDLLRALQTALSAYGCHSSTVSVCCADVLLRARESCPDEEPASVTCISFPSVNAEADQLVAGAAEVVCTLNKPET